MKTSHPRRARVLVLLTTISFAAILALLTLDTASGAASASNPRSPYSSAPRVLAVASRSVPRPLAVAAQRSRRADRNLVAMAKALRKCLTAHPTKRATCDAARGALQYAGSQLKLAEQQLASVASADAYNGAHASRYSTLHAPRLSVSREKLKWTRVRHVKTYVLVAKVPGQTDHYWTITGTSTTPPPVPGVTVRYSVRTAVAGSKWAAEQSISYPNPSETGPTGPGAPAPPASQPTDTQAAPKLSASGLTLSWTQVGSVTTYVLAIKAPGQPTRYTEVTGTSYTPSAVPGATVYYGVRTAVEGSAWAPEVTISFPSTSPPPAPTLPEPEKSQPGSPLTSPMWVGVDVGGWPSQFAPDVAGAADYVRLDQPSSIAGWTAAGVKVIDVIDGPENSGGVSAINATEWAAGAVATVRANPAIAALEVLNEPGNQWMGWGSNAGDAANAAAYDHLLKVVHEAMVANFGSHYPPLLASYDGGEGPTTWGEEMWAAEPNVGNYINGITLHTYGGNSNRTNSALGARDRVETAHAQHPNIPIYVTEVGWPTAVGQPPTGDSLQWTEAEQAANITNFITWAKATGYVADVTIFNYRDYGTNDFYGIETAAGAHKLSYAALAAFK
jgi:hypothetical protein